MALSHRLLTMLESELNKLVVFSYDVVRRIGRSGSTGTFLRVWMSSDAPVALAEVRGLISPTKETGRFEPTLFSVESLEPRREVEVATIPIARAEPDVLRALRDQAVVVRFRGRADLAAFSFSAPDHPAEYAERMVGCGRRVRDDFGDAQRHAPSRRARSIPLSR